MSAYKHKVLVVDDEPQIRKLLTITLKTEDMAVTDAENGGQGVRLARSVHPDIILLDLGLPDIDGQEVIPQIREFSQAPIMVLSVRSEGEEIVQALDNGADDYLTKPFNTGELIARINSLLRRALIQKSELGETVEVGPLHIDMLRYEAKLNGNLVDLSRKEFALLHYFACNPNKALTHQMILKEVWGPAHADDQQYLRVYMGQLRKKLSVNGEEPSYLRTLQGVGYMFDLTAV